MAVPTSKRVLFVSEEIHLFRKLENIFQDDVDLLLASSALEALTLLNGLPVDIAICDQRLPNETGLALLEKIGLDSPQTHRILIISKLELDEVVEALNNGTIERLLVKPFKVESLTSTVGELLAIPKYSQSEFETFFDQTAVGISRIAPNGDFLKVNSQFCSLTGYSRSELLNLSCQDLIHSSHHAQWQKLLWQLNEKELNHTKMELQLQQKDSNSIWIGLTISTAGNLKTNQEFLVLTWEDISEKRMAEETLLKNEEWFRSISSSMADWFWEIDEHARYLYVGGKIKETLGYTPNEVIGKSLFSLMAKEELETKTRWFQDLTSLKKPIVNFEYWAIRKDLRKILLMINATPLTDDTGVIVGYRGVAKDITEEKRKEEELQAHQENLEQLIEEKHSKLKQLSRIIEQGPFSIAIMDHQGLVEYVNPKFLEVTGFSSKAVLMKPHLSLTGDHLPPEMSRTIWQTLKSGQIWQGEVTSCKHNGDPLYENMTISPLKDSQGTLTHFVVLSEDITEKKEAEGFLKQQVDELDANRRALLNMMEDLEVAKSEAELATKAKSAFLANMSHEIRTPMNAVLGFISLALEAPDISRQQHRNLMIAYTSAKSLLSLINDILDVSKLESGKMELDEIPFFLPKLMNDTLQTLDISAREKGLNLIVEIDHRIPQTVIGDPSRLKQILLNLIGNSIKFTQKGSVSVTVFPWKEEGTVLFSIIDTGIGIDQDRLKTIFDPFTQADGSTSRRYGGTGLGTTISRQLVELMGGKIWVNSEQNKGSSFHFTSRLLETDQSPQNLDPSPDTLIPALNKPHRCFRILLAEDIETNRTLAKIRLEQQGHTLYLASNGHEAIEIFKHEQIDLVLMDIQMPDMDGIEATRQIRNLTSESGPYIPIIALTASVMKMDIENYKAVGMDSVVGKPIDFHQLFTIMEKLAPRGVGKVSAKEPAIVLPIKALPISGLDSINLKRALRTWQNTEAYIAALKGFAKDHRHTIEELSYKTAQGKTKDARKLLHALKGVAGNLSIDTVADLAGQISHKLKIDPNANISDLLWQLTESLRTVIDQIDSYELTEATQGVPHKDLDPIQLKNIFASLLSAFDQYNPDAVTPFLDELREYLLEEQVAPISKQIDQFNFDGAKHEAFELAKRLSLGLE